MIRRRAAAAAMLALLLAALPPAGVGAHSELVASDPADGAILTDEPRVISGDFSEELDAARSVMELRAPDGSVLATGRMPAGGPATRMAIVDLPAIAAGTYEVRWTTVTADDDGVERGTFTFTLVAATPSPSPIAEPASSAPPSPSPTPASPPSPTPGPATGSTTGDVVVPLVVLAAILVGGGVWLVRRRR
jgi:LPXTG-motif cell wall-anchored protein